MKKIFIVILLAIFTLAIAGCGESLKTKTKLSAPASEQLKDNILQTGTVAGSEDTKEPVEKPLSQETFPN